MLLYIAGIVLGFVLLLKGGDYLVEGAVSIARLARLSPMVIGLTVVGFGTSAPELLVSVQAALANSPGICIGNVVGSNIANIGMILGITGLICTIPAKHSTLCIDMPFMLLSVFLMVVVGLSGTIYRFEGLFFVALLMGFVAWQVKNSRKHPDPDAENSLSGFRQHNIWVAILIVLASCAALAIGAKMLIYGASGTARWIGEILDADPKEMERIIGLTIVAAGTSMPELFASVMAARRGQTDMAIGNIIGSITFNILSVVGLSAIICPIHNTDAGFISDYAVMAFISVLLYFFILTKNKLSRWEGLVLLLLYIAYLVWLCV